MTGHSACNSTCLLHLSAVLVFAQTQYLYFFAFDVQTGPVASTQSPTGEGGAGTGDNVGDGNSGVGALVGGTGLGKEHMPHVNGHEARNS